jgi:hypothetical protein
MAQLLWKTWWFFKKLKIDYLTYDSAIPLWGIYLKNLKSGA